MNRFEYVTPKKISEAVALLRAEGNVRAKSGGADLVALMKDRIIAPERLVNLQGLALRGIEVGRPAPPHRSPWSPVPPDTPAPFPSVPGAP